MPFVSQSQRAYMYANHPQMAKEWESHTPKGEKLPEHASQELAKQRIRSEKKERST